MSDEGLDDSKMSLTEHLGELRVRLLISLIAVLVTTSVSLIFAPEILDYSITPLTKVLSDRNRVETILVHDVTEAFGAKLAGRLDDHERIRFHGTTKQLTDVTKTVEERIAAKRPIDLILVSTKAIGDDGALVSDLLEGVDPAPYVAYLVEDKSDPVILELQLEGAIVLLQPVRTPVLNRVIRRAAATAGKATSADKLVVLSPLEPFFAYLKIALVCGLFLACPIWLFQIWQFVAPGLYTQEKKVVFPSIAAASLLFIAGGLFAYYAMFPMMFDVLVNQMMPASLTGSFTVDKYLGLLLRVTVAFGVVFELPLAIALLAAVGIVTADGLRRFRKYAVVFSFILSAFLTPADPLSQVMMAAPLVIFYEVGIILAAILGKRRANAMALAKTDA